MWLKRVRKIFGLERRDDSEFARSAAAAVLDQQAQGARSLLWAIVAFVLCFMLWASLAKVEEFTRGVGKVIPSQQVQVIQNLEGGIVAELFVREGDYVQRGQNLLRIDDKRFASSLREADVTLQQLQLKSTRLRAEADGLPFAPPDEDLMTDILQREMDLYQLRLEELQSRRQVLDQQWQQKRQEATELKAHTEQLQRSVELSRRELEATRLAAADGAVSEVELLRLEREVNQREGELEASQLALPRAQSAVDEAKEKLENVDLSFRRDAREELNKVTLELSQLTESSGALADRVDRTLVRSPVAGTVKRLLVATIGGVIQPGMDLVEIVPTEEILLVEAKVRPADIAYLHPGQKATVQFSAYEFSKYGGLEGKLVLISPDTIENEEGESFYLVRVETASSFRDPEGRDLPIIPGMTVTVDVRSGEKTVMEYLLKPILRTKQLALRER